ncbi:MAG: energy-coupling factor ABC transporter ATP-binding protein [Clostridia bacterium]|nr:energy-coupling factor ABC transporter ATP-binding protein [Clostridia bacterium]
MKAIELKNVSFSYGKSEEKVLCGVDFNVGYGEVALLSGHSGEGKSTLLAVVSGIIPNIVPGTVTGEVLIDGEDIKGRKLSSTCRKVGVVLQNADSQIIHKTVEDEVAFGCENFAFPPDEITKQVDRVLTLMKLEKFWRTRSLSGGQKQRLITASTLATGQKILILDEPLANLDTCLFYTAPSPQDRNRKRMPCAA